jgi:hypothetical protein
MTAVLDPDRLRKLCGMFGSDHDGEVSNAARMADKLVRAAGLTWADVIAAPAKVSHAKPPEGYRANHGSDLDWRDLRDFCLKHMWTLSAKERSFIIDLGRWHRLTPKQRDWLQAIHDRVRRQAA